MSATLDHLRAALAGRYRVDREIGAGGMATVFLADDVRHNRKVAIKVLKEDLAASVGAARFLREIQIAAQRLTSERFGEFAGTLSPDGARLAYHAFRKPGLRQVEVRRTDGGPVERMTPASHQQSNASWSPDGTAIAYFNPDPPGGGWIVRQATNGAWGAPVKQCVCMTAGWVDDHTILVASLGLVQGRPRALVATHDVTNGTEHPVFEWLLGSELLQWVTLSADRRSLIYKTGDPSGRAKIWIVPLAGGASRLLVRFTNPDRPSYRGLVSATQTHLFFTIDDRQSDIAVAELVKR